MENRIDAYAAPEASAPFEPFSYELAPIGLEDVDIKVDYCGMCHSGLSVWQNAWGRSRFPLVAGHEIVGTVVSVGAVVNSVKVGDKVGLEWFSDSSMHCKPCLSGQHNLCDDVRT